MWQVGTTESYSNCSRKFMDWKLFKVKIQQDNFEKYLTLFSKLWDHFFFFPKTNVWAWSSNLPKKNEHYLATATIYAFQASCCWKHLISSYFASRETPNPSVFLISLASGISRSQKCTDRNPASSKQSLISGNDHLRR